MKKMLDDRADAIREKKLGNTEVPHESKIKSKVDLELRLNETLLYYDKQESPMRLAIPILSLGVLFGGIGIGGAFAAGFDGLEEGIIVLIVGVILFWLGFHWILSYFVSYYFVTDKRLCLRTVNWFNIPVKRDIQAGSVLSVSIEESTAPLSTKRNTIDYLEVKVKNEKKATVKSVSDNIILMKTSIEKLI